MLLDLTPEEAQKLIAGRSLAVNYARQLDEGPLSSSPDGANRKFYHNGKQIDNPNDFVQRTYEASQFHAQDGLGRSMFGYSDWNQGRLEARNANGEVRGSYQYVDPYGEDVIVSYQFYCWFNLSNRFFDLGKLLVGSAWFSSNGQSTQIRNGPCYRNTRSAGSTCCSRKGNKVKDFIFTTNPLVLCKRIFIMKAWAAAAAAARQVPDPMSDVYNANSNKLDEEQSEADQAMEIISGVANQQQQSLSRYPNLPYTNQIQEDEEGAFSHDSVVVESTGEARDNKQLGKIRIESEDEEVEPSNPRGFFYNFDYPVQLILENTDDRQQRSTLADQKSEKTSKNDKIELNPTLEAEVAEYKIVKRSENSKDAEHIDVVSEKNIEKDDKAPENVKQTQDEKSISKEIPKQSSENTQPKTVEAQIPVFVKVESEEDQPSDLLLKSEMELRRLATNEGVIDAIHDAQVHRRVQA